MRGVECVTDVIGQDQHQNSFHPRTVTKSSRLLFIARDGDGNVEDDHDHDDINDRQLTKQKHIFPYNLIKLVWMYEWVVGIK